MSVQDNLATSCVLNLMSLVEPAVPEFLGRVWHIYGEEELRAKDKGLKFPAIGVIYDGLRPMPSAGPQSGSGGGGALSCEMLFSVLLFLRLQPIALDDPKQAATTQMDTVRRAILGKRAPSGHFWKFQLEVSAPNGKGSVAYIQRWVTTVQLA